MTPDPTAFRLPSKPPRSSHFGRNLREPIARLACIFLASAPDPARTLRDGVRKATRREHGVSTATIEGREEPIIDASSLVALAAHKAGVDMTDERQAEAFLEYAQSCMEHYRGEI